jgi:hypothetical protein
MIRYNRHKYSGIIVILGDYREDVNVQESYENIKHPSPRPIETQGQPIIHPPKTFSSGSSLAIID